MQVQGVHAFAQTRPSKTKSETGCPTSFCFWKLLSTHGSKELRVALCQWPPMWLKSLFQGCSKTYCPHRLPSPRCQTLPSPSVQPDAKECPAASPLLQNSAAAVNAGYNIHSLFLSFCCVSNMTLCGFAD